MVKGHRVASRGLAARRRVILQANDAGPHLRRGSAWCGDVSPAHLSSSAGAAERDAQPVRVTCPVCGSMVKVAITEPSSVASENPIAPSDVGATLTTFHVWLPCQSRKA